MSWVELCPDTFHAKELFTPSVSNFHYHSVNQETFLIPIYACTMLTLSAARLDFQTVPNDGLRKRQVTCLKAQTREVASDALIRQAESNPRE